MNGNLLTDRNVIRNMWADHFEALGTPSKTSILTTLFSIALSLVFMRSLTLAQITPLGVLCKALDYDEVACVCSKPKLGVSGLCIDHEHIRFVGPPVWRLLFEMYQNFYANGSVCESLKTGVMLPLFKGKGAKANNKANYRGRTLFLLCVKFMRWCFSTDLKTMLNKTDCFRICSLDFKKV